jgi:hypothetical protein
MPFANCGDEVKHQEERHANAKLDSRKLSLTYGWIPGWGKYQSDVWVEPICRDCIQFTAVVVLYDRLEALVTR